MTMDRRVREIRESPTEQGTDEQITYTLNTTPWGGGPTNVDEVKVYRMESNGALTDVTATVCSGSAVINSNVITLPEIANLEIGKTYRVEVLYSKGASKLEAFGFIQGTR